MAGRPMPMILPFMSGPPRS
ncbi:hypothetical protein [Paracoccus sediminis]